MSDSDNMLDYWIDRIERQFEEIHAQIEATNKNLREIKDIVEVSAA